MKFVSSVPLLFAVVVASGLVREGASFVAVRSSEPIGLGVLLRRQNDEGRCSSNGIRIHNRKKNRSSKYRDDDRRIRPRMGASKDEHHHPSPPVVTQNQCPHSHSHPHPRRRRRFLRDAAVALLSASTLSFSSPSFVAAHAAMKSSQTVFEVGKDLTLDEARARFRQGQESLDQLLQNYDSICEGGGDNIRRYLGTVGTSSGLYGIAKVMKILQEAAPDIVEYTETMDEVNAALVGADGSAYMAIFTESSTSGVPKEKYYGDAKIEVRRAIGSMKELAKQLDLP